jgi:MarR family
MVASIENAVWVQITVTLTKLTDVYQRAFEHLSISVIEAYILRALYEQDGLRAGELANAVGRAPMSFTPTLDKLEHKELSNGDSIPKTDDLLLFISPKLVQI